MFYREAMPSPFETDAWIAEATDHATEKVYTAMFQGTDFEQRSIDYVAWMNGTLDTPFRVDSMLVYEVTPSPVFGNWVATAVNNVTEEEYRVLFLGPDAEKRARDYAAWMNGDRG